MRLILTNKGEGQFYNNNDNMIQQRCEAINSLPRLFIRSSYAWGEKQSKLN